MKNIFYSLRNLSNRYKKNNRIIDGNTTVKDVVYSVVLGLLKSILWILLPSLLLYNLSIYPFIYQLMPIWIYIIVNVFIYLSIYYYYKHLKLRVNEIKDLNTKLLLNMEFMFSLFVTTIILIIFLSFV
ncbi:MAG TPA: hypothetical protein GXZ79_02555 [Acholeplasma sp.]|jgi:hypothetical protein|nr:hypothetical protein [Acholeplasma sp.]